MAFGIFSSFFFGMTVAVGLFGLHKKITLVFSFTADKIPLTSNEKFSGSSGTSMTFAPCNSAKFLYAKNAGEEIMHSNPGSKKPRTINLGIISSSAVGNNKLLG